MKMGFGIHKDKSVAEVPLHYLSFIASQGWFVNVRLPVRKAICERLNIPLVERPNPYRKNFSGVAKGKGIMERDLQRRVDADDFRDANFR